MKMTFPLTEDQKIKLDKDKEDTPKASKIAGD